MFWGQELALALRQLDDALDETTHDQATLKDFGEELKKTLRSVWDEPPSDVFELEYVSSLLTSPIH